MTAEQIVVQVAAVREGRLWVLQLEDGGVRQARHLGEIDAMVSDYVSLLRGVPVENIVVEVTKVDPGQKLSEEISAARAAQTDAARAQERAASRIRSVAVDLKRLGLTGVEIASVLGVSPQRVSQLTAAPKDRESA